MKVKFLSVLALVFIAITAFVPKNNMVKYQNEVVYMADTAHSRVDWVGSKKGGYHPGYFPLKSGQIKMHDGKIAGGSFVINVAGVKVTDEAGVKLEDHLKSADFFDVSKFGEATYTIKEVNYTKENVADIKGTLNIKGLPVPVSLTAYIRSAGENKFFAQAFFSVDRNLLNIAPGSPYLSNDVQIGVHLFGTK